MNKIKDILQEVLIKIFVWAYYLLLKLIVWIWPNR